jgi:hypothetical protein
MIPTPTTAPTATKVITLEFGILSFIFIYFTKGTKGHGMGAIVASLAQDNDILTNKP